MCVCLRLIVGYTMLIRLACAAIGPPTPRLPCRASRQTYTARRWGHDSATAGRTCRFSSFPSEATETISGPYGRSVPGAHSSPCMGFNLTRKIISSRLVLLVAPLRSTHVKKLRLENRRLVNLFRSRAPPKETYSTSRN